MSERGSVAVFCPTSNLFLGSGLFDWQRYGSRDNKLRIAAATDVGGGTNYSMLRTMDEGYKVIALQAQDQPAGQLLADHARQCRGAVTFRAHWHAGTGHRCRSRRAGCKGNTGNASAHGNHRNAGAGTILLQTLGDDRAVAQTYIAGKPVKDKPVKDKAG